MNIKNLLQSTNSRIVLYDRWLVMDDNEFHVYERKPYARKTVTIYYGYSEMEAVKCLMNQEE